MKLGEIEERLARDKWERHCNNCKVCEYFARNKALCSEGLKLRKEWDFLRYKNGR